MIARLALSSVIFTFVDLDHGRRHLLEYHEVRCPLLVLTWEQLFLLSRVFLHSNARSFSFFKFQFLIQDFGFRIISKFQHLRHAICLHGTISYLCNADGFPKIPTLCFGRAANQTNFLCCARASISIYVQMFSACWVRIGSEHRYVHVFVKLPFHLQRDFLRI